jgi:periplasmic protein TonB
MKPAQVGTQEAPITAEFQVLSDTQEVSSSTPAAAAAEESNAIPEPHASLPLTDGVEQMALEVIPVEAGISTSHEQNPVDPIPAKRPLNVSTPSPAPPAHRSVPHPVARARRGAKNVLPDYLNNPPPQYPESSRISGEQGVVLVRAMVGTSGDVTRVSLSQSSGYPALDRAAVEAVKGWKFHPASAAGIAMTSEVTVPVRFQLHEGKVGTIRNP